MNLLLLVIAVFILLFSLRRLSKITYFKKQTIIQEAKQNAISLFLGIPIILAILFIPYQTWILTGSSHYWDGVYIIGGTTLITITISFIFYYKIAVKIN